jgi:phage baseplate assembly protein W
MGSYNYNIALGGEQLEARDFTFKDIRVPIRKDASNYDLVELLDLDAIKQSIRNIIDWTPGERILNPEFGNQLWQYMYEPINSDTAGRIANSLMVSIETWEPRVSIQSLSVIPKEDNNEYYVTLIYEIPSLGITGVEYPAILSN